MNMLTTSASGTHCVAMPGTGDASPIVPPTMALPYPRSGLGIHGSPQKRSKFAGALCTCRSALNGIVRQDLDQCPATLPTVARRVNLLAALPAGEPNQLLLLGDDDCLSVGVSHCLQSAHTTVVDLDAGLLEVIRTHAAQLRVSTILTDMREPLPSGLVGRHDAVFTDPPYTLAGQLVFLRQAMVGSQRHGRSHIFLCFSRFYLSVVDINEIVSFGRAGGYTVRATFEDFNDYVAPHDVVADMACRGVELTGGLFHSSLLWFERVSELSDIPNPHKSGERSIYDYTSHGEI